jgi:NAD binding domain of 6-phosphogluconate dehydrogenase
MSELKIGFVGLGNQGAPMAEAISDAGFERHVWARRAQSFDAISRVKCVRHDSLKLHSAASNRLISKCPANGILEIIASLARSVRWLARNCLGLRLYSLTVANRFQRLVVAATFRRVLAFPPGPGSFPKETFSPSVSFVRGVPLPKS